MMTADGPRVLEYNVRFGDPETQAVLPRLRTDLLELLEPREAPGGLSGATPRVGTGRWAVTVVLASARLPGELVQRRRDHRAWTAIADDVEVTHAGTARGRRPIVTAGGRVLNVTGLGADAAEARDAAYAAADMIEFEGKQMRRDIALRAVRA